MRRAATLGVNDVPSQGVLAEDGQVSYEVWGRYRVGAKVLVNTERNIQ